MISSGIERLFIRVNGDEKNGKIGQFKFRKLSHHLRLRQRL